MMDDLEIRRRFENWITSSPYERSIMQLDGNTMWPNQYSDYETELAWQSWKEAVRHIRNN